jgi:copper chaperone
MSCDHCRAAITAEVQSVPGVTRVEVDVDAKRVTVEGDCLDDAAIRLAIDGAGYDVEVGLNRRVATRPAASPAS